MYWSLQFYVLDHLMACTVRVKTRIRHKQNSQNACYTWGFWSHCVLSRCCDILTSNNWKIHWSVWLLIRKWLLRLSACLKCLYANSFQICQKMCLNCQKRFHFHPKNKELSPKTDFDNKLGYTDNVHCFVNLVHIFVTLLSTWAQRNFNMFNKK